MSRPLTLRDKIRLFWLLVIREKRNDTDGVTVDCGVCHSDNTRFETQFETEDASGNVIYKSRYTCKTCGATCENVQNWTPNPQIKG